MDAVSIIFAFGLGFAARQIQLPPLVGYLAAGFVLHALGVDGGPALSYLADLGVTLLLFTIGLKLKLSVLGRAEVWGVAGAHMLGSAVVLGSGLWLLTIWAAGTPGLALDREALLTIAFALSFSSTVFAVKALEERGDMTARHGRIAVGILVLQDLFAVAYLVLATGKAPSIYALGLLALPLLRPLAGALLQRSGHGELLILFGLSVALGGAALFELVGIKGDLGALVFGILLAPHRQAAELAKALLGFKDLFLIGFFLTIGLLGIPGWEAVGIAALLTALVLLKAAGFFALLLAFRVRFRTTVMSTLALATYSEFGLIVVILAVGSGVLEESWVVVLALAVSFSFVLASPLNVFARDLYVHLDRRLRRLERPQPLPEDAPLALGQARILVCGMGRVGTAAYDELKRRYGDPVLGVDRDEDRARAHREAGREVLVAECTDPDFWEQVGAARPALVLLAMPNQTENLFAAERLAEGGHSGAVCATAQFPDEVAALRAAGCEAYNLRADAGVGFAELASMHYTRRQSGPA